MKIVHVVLTPRYSGAEIFVRDLSIAQKKQGDEVVIIALNPSESSFNVEMQELERLGISYIRPSKKLNKIGRVSYLRDFFSKYDPSVIFAHSIIPSAYARLADLGQRKRVCTVLHSASEKDYTGIYWVFSEYVLSRRLLGVIGVSQKGLETYRSMGFHKTPNMLVKNGIDIEKIISYGKSRLMNTSQDIMINNKKVFLQVGRLSDVKRQHLSILAFHQLVQTRSDVELWFAGIVESEEYKQKLVGIINELKLNDQVKLLGPRSDIYKLLYQADVYLMPSLFEAQSIAMLEALASGVCIICSDISSFSDHFNREGVVVVNPEDISVYSNAMRLSLQFKSRFSHDMTVYDISETANAYRCFALRALSGCDLREGDNI